MNYSDPP